MNRLKRFLRGLWAWLTWDDPHCTCLGKYATYCPRHDGDYGTWKFGQYGEEWDE